MAVLRSCELRLLPVPFDAKRDRAGLVHPGRQHLHRGQDNREIQRARSTHARVRELSFDSLPRIKVFVETAVSLVAPPVPTAPGTRAGRFRHSVNFVRSSYFTVVSSPSGSVTDQTGGIRLGNGCGRSSAGRPDWVMVVTFAMLGRD